MIGIALKLSASGPAAGGAVWLLAFGVWDDNATWDDGA